ncbi:MAG: NAD(P)H-binding protein [Pseudomonadota bacterium]|nr:NAD(P)H-binding protein [Pseudomonadota bacterium]
MVVFVAGATGATGQVLVPLASAAGFELRLHVRPATAPKSPLGADPRARIFDLGDADALREALRGCDAVISLIGTMRSRFDAGDTYASSDVGTTRALVDAARAAGVPRFLLLSSVGAGGAGPYLQMKGECEELVRSSGLGWTIFRPSALASPSAGPAGTHGKRWVPPGATALTAALRGVPGIGGLVARYGPIPIEVLARAMVRTLEAPGDGGVIEGAELWEKGT